MAQYYDGTKLLSLKDKNDNNPSIYICVGNRTAGKSVYFKRLLLNSFIKKGQKFILLYRFTYELPSCAEMFFSDIGPLFFPTSEMEAVPIAKGLFFEMYFNGDICGYAVSLSSADAIKKYSAYFNDVENVFLDEFQSETEHYAPKEMTKFQSIIVTISRGHGKQFRDVRIFLVSNAVSIMNPYFVQFGIHKRLRNDTKFMRGDGWVMEYCYNESAATAIASSAFARAFQNSEYIGYAQTNVYLNDNTAFIEKMSGKHNYITTLVIDKKEYAVKQYEVNGNTIFYVDDVTEPCFCKLTFKGSDHNEGLMLINKNEMMMSSLRRVFDHGMMRFKDLECKNVMFDVMAVK